MRAACSISRVRAAGFDRARPLSIATAVTAFACALYFWSRLAHVVVFMLGIPVLRTLSFAGGFLAQALLVLAIFKLI
jgi:uncharacterized membrane protein required for colicin V production